MLHTRKIRLPIELDYRCMALSPIIEVILKLVCRNIVK